MILLFVSLELLTTQDELQLGTHCFSCWGLESLIMELISTVLVVLSLLASTQAQDVGKFLTSKSCFIAINPPVHAEVSVVADVLDITELQARERGESTKGDNAKTDRKLDQSLYFNSLQGIMSLVGQSLV